jgi:hypothetical protein
MKSMKHFTIELNGRKYIVWKDANGQLGFIEVVINGWSYQTRQIWGRGKPLGPTATRVVRALEGVESLGRAAP